MLNIIPDQIEGKKTDLSHSETFASKEEAIRCFSRARNRLLNPRVWHELGGSFSAEFYLNDEYAHDPHRLAQIYDHIKIDVPGPGPSSGRGYDWVKVEQIEDNYNENAEEESIGITVKPCKDPTNNNHNVAHFFTSHASSSFIIRRKGIVVTSSYHGRNELPNIHTDSNIDNIRNAVVASGAMATLSEVQWMTLIKAFLKPELGG